MFVPYSLLTPMNRLRTRSMFMTLSFVVVISAGVMKVLMLDKPLELNTFQMPRIQNLITIESHLEDQSSQEIDISEALKDLKKIPENRASWYTVKAPKVPDAKQFLFDVSIESGLPKELLYYQWLLESSGDCSSRSHKSAVGCFQFTDVTAREFGLIRTVNGRRVDLRSNLKASADAAARHLQYLGVLMYGTDLDLTDWDQLKHVLAAYNAGLSNVRRGNSPPTLPKFSETLRYVNLLQMLVDKKAVYVEPGDTISNIALRMQITEDQLLKSNPDLKDGDTPTPGTIVFTPEPNAEFAEIVVAYNQSLQSISAGTGVDIKSLKEANNLKATKLKPGVIINIPLDN